MIHLTRACGPLIRATASGRNVLTIGAVDRASAAHQVSRSLSLTSSFRNSSGENEFRHSEDLAKERYDLRANEDIDRKRARLLYQSRKRGMLENGVILSSFADKYLDTFSAEQLDEYDRLINLPTNDWDIFYWATKTKPTPPEFETAVMQMLRQHLNKKVSKSANLDDAPEGAIGDKETGTDSSEQPGQKKSESIFDGRRPDEVLFPARKKQYQLDIEPSEIDLVNYRDELFDPRTKQFRNGQSIVRMTEWRRKFFERRLRRAISSPVSLQNLSADKETPVYTQKVPEKSIASETLLQNDLVDSEAERSLKHHNFVQYLLSNEFTDRLDEYEWEAEAWSNTMWLRNYGKSDISIAPSHLKCSSCDVKLHCCDPGLDGYMPKELFAQLNGGPAADQQERRLDVQKCQRCRFSETYQAQLGADVDKSEFIKAMQNMRHLPPSVICLLVDLTDFPAGIWAGLADLIGTPRHRLIVVGNKLDLLPIDGQHIVDRVTFCLRKNLAKLRRPGNQNLHVHDVAVLSARTGFGVENLVSKLLALTESPRDVYLLGCANAGKSTLFNALLQSDLSAIREVDLMARVSREENILDSGVNLLKFPINRAEGWEIELKKRRSVRVMRNTAVLERSLANLTKFRQATMPHMSMLIDRLEYPSATDEQQQQQQLRLQHDHDDDGDKAGSSSSAVTLASQSEPDEASGLVVNFSDDHPFKKIEQRALLSASCEAFKNHSFFYQTPSARSNPDQLHDLLTNDERLEVFPNETIVPRKYTLRPLQSIFVAGLARLDLVTANSTAKFTIFTSKYLPIHVIATRKADQFYRTFLGSPYLGVPFGDEQRLREWPQLVSGGGGGRRRRSELKRSSSGDAGGAGHDDSRSEEEGDDDCINVKGTSDIVLSSAGWAMIELGCDQECLVRAWTPQGRGIYHRSPPLLAYGGRILGGKKIRDTPLFVHPHFSIDQISVPAASSGSNN